jgi:hypothetical protein
MTPTLTFQRFLLGLRALLPRLLPALRVSAYLALVSLCCSVFAVRAARAAFGEVSLALGQQLHEVSDLLGTSKLVELNGQPFRISTTVAPELASVVLDRFAEACRNHPSELARMSSGAAGSTRLAAARDASGHEPLVRLDGKGDGVLGCLVDSAQSGVRSSLPEAMRSFLSSRDAGVFGDFLVVYAKDQGKGKSHVVAVWTRGSFKVLDLFPERGDAPGSDSVLAGRPRDARRILSGAASGEPYGVRIYESSKAPAELLASFESDMLTRGWSQLSRADARTSSRTLMHDSGVLAILSTSMSGGKSALALMEMGNGETPRTRSAGAR